MVKPIPDGFTTVTPYMRIRDAAKALDFYKKAFGAEEVCRMDMAGKVGHAEIRIGGAMIMLGDEFPDYGCVGPATLKGTTVGIHLYVSDVDAAVKRAADAGAVVQQPPTDMFWGDRFAKVKDPFGHEWSIATHKEDVTPEEMQRRMKADPMCNPDKK